MRDAFGILIGLTLGAALTAFSQPSAPVPAPAPCEDRLATVAQFADLQRQGRDQAEVRLAEERAGRVRLEAQLAEARSALVKAAAAPQAAPK